MGKSRFLERLRNVISNPIAYYGLTLTISAWLTIASVSRIHEAYERNLSDQQIFTFSMSIFLPILACLWGARFIRDWIRHNKATARALGDEADDANEAFRTLIETQYGRALVDNIFAYEAFWTKSYQIDLNRHTIATAIVMASAVISISMGLLIFSRVPAAEGSISPYVTALGGALPALVTATSLKIWLETRKNLNATAQQVDLLLRQRIRLIVFWSGRGQFASSEQFEDHVHATSLFLEYLRSGSDHETPEAREKRHLGRRAKEPPVATVEILRSAAN
jgi:hypothetical protein